MAEYYAVLSKAVASLEVSTPETRRAVYDKARNALIGQLKAIVPPLPTSEISRQRLELEEAIRRAEREANAAGSGGPRTVARPAATQPPPQAAAPPPPPPPPEVEEVAVDDNRPSPQDVFRRAIQEAESRGRSEAPPMERAPPAPPRREPAYDDRVELRAERMDRSPPAREESSYAVPAADYRSDRRGPPAPRLAPDYEWEQAPAAPPPPRYGADPYVDTRDRPAKIRDARRRNGRDESERDDDLDMGQESRPSRLPTILLLVLILAMVGGLGALAWSQRSVISELLANLDSGSGETAAVTSAQPPPPLAPAPVVSSKDADRLPGGASPADATSPGVRVVQPAGSGDPAVAPALAGQPAAANGDALVAQKAVLYEEPLDSAAAAKGVTQISAVATWSFVSDSQDGPQIVAQIDVPDRKLKIKLSIRKNSDKSIPASHLVEVVATVPADFPGKGIKSVPRLVLKPSEDARGQPLIGASAKVADGFFWVALSALENDIKANLALLRDRPWVDIPLVYETGQRAILSLEKGNQGERAFQRALAAWATTG